MDRRCILVVASIVLSTAGCTALEPSATPSPSQALLTSAAVEMAPVVMEPDIVRFERGTIYTLTEADGLSVIDVSGADPRVLSREGPTRDPLGVFVANGIAWLVHRDTDLPGWIVARAVDVRDRKRPIELGAAHRRGVAKDALLVGDVLVLLHEQDGHAIVESFGVRGRGIARLGRVSLAADPVQLAAAPGIVAVTARQGLDIVVATFDLREGRLLERASTALRGGFPSAPRVGSRVARVDAHGVVQVVVCHAPACATGTGVRLEVVDLATGDWKSAPLSDRGGFPPTSFDGSLLHLATPSTTSGASDVITVRLDEGPAVRRVTVAGRVTSLAARGDALWALGTTRTTAPGAVQLVVHEVDHVASRLRGSASFGAEWVWPPRDAEHALAIDPSGRSLAVPFSAYRTADRGKAFGVQLLVRGVGGPVLGPTVWQSERVERAELLDGGLLLLGAGGGTPRLVEVPVASP